MDALANAWVWISTIALAIVLAASAGLRAWLPLLITSGLARAGLVDLGEGFAFLATTPALALFALATIVEIVADKVPAVDHALDVVSTFVRPAAGSLLAAAVLHEARDPLVATVLGIAIGAPVALAPHVAKAATRSVSTAATGGFGNPVLSLAEDFASFAMTLFAVLVPVLALFGLLLAIVLVRRSRRDRLARRAAASTGAAHVE